MGRECDHFHNYWHKTEDYAPVVRRKRYEVRDAHGEFHSVYATSVMQEGNVISFYDSTQPTGRTLVGYFTAPISVK